MATRWIAFALVVAVLMGCGKKDTADADPTSSSTTRHLAPPAFSADDSRWQAMRAIEGGALAVCACQDAFCAIDANAAFEDAVARSGSSGASEARSRVSECMAKLGANVRPTRAERRSRSREALEAIDVERAPPARPTSGPSDDTSRLVRVYDDLAREVCACKDSTCASDAVSKKTSEIQKFAAAYSSNPDVMKRLREPVEKMSACLKKLTTR